MYRSYLTEAPLSRLCHEVLPNINAVSEYNSQTTWFGEIEYQFQPLAIDALQQSAEEYMVERFKDAREAMLHRVRRQKGRGEEGDLMLKDWRYPPFLRREDAWLDPI
jgi:histone H3/H4